MKRVIALVFGVLVFACVCHAEWIEVYDDDNVTVYVDDDIQKTEAGYWVWDKYVFSKPQYLEGTKKRHDEMIGYDLYSSDFRKKCCHEVIISYNGKVVDNGTFCRGESKYSLHVWKNIVPESVGAEVRDGIKYIVNGGRINYYKGQATIYDVDDVENDEDTPIVERSNNVNSQPKGSKGQSKVSVERGKYYIAKVTANSLNLRNGADSSYDVAYKLNKGASVVVSGDDLLSGGFGMVICDDGSKYGYAAVEYLDPVDELETSPGGAFQEAGELTYSRTVSELEISNTVSAPVTLQFNGLTFQLQPGGKRKFRELKPGSYKFLATAKGYRPLSTIETIKGGYEYSFVIYEVIR